MARYTAFRADCTHDGCPEPTCFPPWVSLAHAAAAAAAATPKVGRCTFTPDSPEVHPRFTPGSPQVHPRFTPGSPQVHSSSPRVGSGLAPGLPQVDRAWFHRLNPKHDELL